ncbi:acyl-CoA dehydrogenase, partial [Candidatus Marinamargulisbacteria bacterium SCGC AG-414-C22]
MKGVFWGAIICVPVYFSLPLWVFSIAFLSILIVLNVSTQIIMVSTVVLSVFTIPIVRRWLVSNLIFTAMKVFKFLPEISKTEKDAIESGTVWMDAELFSGKPNFKKIMTEDYARLTTEEQAFLDGPVEQFCELVNDWEIQQKRDFDPKIFDFIKKERLFGMIIPKKYGGLAFSQIANSSIVQKIASRSPGLGILVMVPNSLGPAELLVHYGTQDQKDYYLPRLAVGKEIPCFALTEPNAGSDAGAMTSTGVVFKKSDDSIWIKLNFEKRYITLAPIATLIGLAFKCEDPDNLLGKGKYPGITCALIPRETNGLTAGNQHDPLGIPFYNGTLRGHNVEVPLSAVIGEIDGVGRGWRMLMECLSAGRGISLPASSSAGGKSVTRVVTAYSMLRKQFGLEIGKFEGIQEPLAQIVGMNYIMEAARCYTCGALAKGEKPAVVSAIMKYHTTEMNRKIINHGMDIVGGAGISLGPRNLLANAYMCAPIAITVEGANILTRNLMIFGQGAIRCHPYALQEIKALEDNNLKLFDHAFWKHVGHVCTNLLRTILLGVSRGRLSMPYKFGATRRYYQKLSWASATFAFYTDIALLMLGGGLKIRERITARFSDILSWLYLGSAVLRRFEADGAKQEDLAFVHWSMNTAFQQIQHAFEELFTNLGPLFFVSKVLTVINPFSKGPTDKQDAKMVQAMQIPGKIRNKHTAGIYISKNTTDSLGRLESVFEKSHKLKPLYISLKKAVKKKIIKKGHIIAMINQAKEKKVITADEADAMHKLEMLRDDVIQVDEFSRETYL